VWVEVGYNDSKNGVTGNGFLRSSSFLLYQEIKDHREEQEEVCEAEKRTS